MPSNKAAIDWITRTLATMGAFCVVTVCILAIRGIQIPPELNTLTGGLVGSLASMLVKTSPTETSPTPPVNGTGTGAPVDVNITNPPEDAANVKLPP